MTLGSLLLIYGAPPGNAVQKNEEVMTPDELLLPYVPDAGVAGASAAAAAEATHSRFC
jgi:hypothetical protein